MHYPYTAFLKNTGLTIKFLRLQWHTTALNRTIVKWTTGYPKLFELSFNIGVYFTIILMPIASVLIIMSALHTTTGSSNSVMGASKTGQDSATVELLMPGINLPINEIGYYIVALAVNSIVHELGHGLAAVLEDVPVRGFGFHIFLMLPVAYTHLDPDQFNNLRPWKKLKVLCAGIWYNVILAIFTYLIFLSSPFLLSLLYKINESVIVTHVKNHSPVTGIRGLDIGDVITSINNCEVKNEDSYYQCLSDTLKIPPAYCVSTDFVHLNDESVPMSHKNDGLIECCDPDSHASNCFENLIDENEEDNFQLPQLMCLNIRKTIENSFDYCNKILSCSEGHCFKPIINNYTTIVQIKRDKKTDVIYIGHPSDILRSIQISQFVPKTSIVNSGFADAYTLLLKYITVFSFGLAIINVIPCFGFDGQHIVNTILVNMLLAKQIPQKQKKDLISLCVNIIGTLFVFILLTKILWQTIFKAILI